MKDTTRPVYNKLLISGIILGLILIMQPAEVYYLLKDIVVLFPKGIIGLKERNLMLLLQALMLIIVIPVYIFTFAFSWWYRADNDDSVYDPHLVDHKIAEVIWWGLPLVLTIIVSIITWYKTYELDPYRPIQSDKPPLVVEVVALDWKWLFLYPEEKVAAVNYLRIPKDRPIHFHITADAPMNSFWIPRLGGQIYAMAGMRTQLFLMADEEGEFRGSSANISGEGFSKMRFVTHVTTEEEYNKWIKTVQGADKKLTWETYKNLAKQTIDHPVELFQLKEEKLFHKILMKFMEP